nr:CHAD domain-containing protein [Geodermatophilaceae bacterium]
RKKAKRARYAAEVAVPLVGRPARQFVREMTRVQTALGHAQDGAVSVQELELLAPTVDNAFALGRLQVLEEQRLTARFGIFGPVWKRASQRSRRRWLR